MQIEGRSLTFRRIGVFGFVCLVGLIGFYIYKSRDLLPSFAQPDLGVDSSAAKVSELFGKVWTRPLEQLDHNNALPKPFSDKPEVLKSEGWNALSLTDKIFVGMVFHVGGNKSFVYLQTYGNFFARADENAEFIFLEAKKSADGSKNYAKFIVKKGLFRVRPYDYDKTDHWLEIVTPFARVIGHKSEIGVSIKEDGHGDLWSVDGETIVINDKGEKRKIVPKGLNHI